jgi:16S rRNA (uracil1498-N3)-methyltransferase
MTVGAGRAMTQTKQRTPRLFLERDLVGTSVKLDDREAHYLGHVLRLKRGDELVAFNGRGTERHARVSTLTRRNGELSLGEERTVQPESTLALTLVQSLAKAEAMDLVVQKATELGVREILPVYSDHSVVKLDSERRERRLEHWKRIAQSACEQCGRHTPPRIAAPEVLPACLARVDRDGNLLLALDPWSPLRLADLPAAAAVTFAVGPEGGFSSTDLDALDAAGFRRVSLGQRVLRTETAAIAACAAAQARWGDF